MQSERWQNSPRSGDGQAGFGQGNQSSTSLHSFDEEETMLLDSQVCKLSIMVINRYMHNLIGRQSNILASNRLLGHMCWI